MQKLKRKSLIALIGLSMIMSGCAGLSFRLAQSPLLKAGSGGSTIPGSPVNNPPPSMICFDRDRAEKILKKLVDLDKWPARCAAMKAGAVNIITLEMNKKIQICRVRREACNEIAQILTRKRRNAMIFAIVGTVGGVIVGGVVGGVIGYFIKDLK